MAVTVEGPGDGGTTDTEAPTLSISNPKDGATVSRTVSVQVQGQDNVAVTSTKLFIDGQLKQSVNGASLEFGWNTRKVSSGSHTITAEVQDAAGNTSSRSITVNVGATSGGGGKGSGGKGGKKAN